MFLFYYVTLCDHMIRGTCDLLNESFSTEVTAVSSLTLVGLPSVRFCTCHTFSIYSKAAY